MKTRFLFFINLLLLAKLGFTQEPPRFKGGILGGLLISDINGAHTRNGSHFNKIGVTFGGIVTASLTSKVTGQMELNFIQKGSLQPPDSNNNGYYKISLSYIEIPVLIKRKLNFMTRKKQVSRFDVEAGASFGRLIGRSIEVGSNSPFPTGDYYNKTDVSLLLGIDYNFTQNVFLCFRYSNSVIPAIKRNTPTYYNYTYTFNRGNNMVVQATLKVLFGGKTEETLPKTVEPAEE